MNAFDYNRRGISIIVPSGRLAVQQWYERDPSLLAAEKAAMQHAFPHFQLDKLDDGRLCWIGELGLSVMGDNKWTVMAVYMYNHPDHSPRVCSIRVYLIDPDIDEMVKKLGKRPFPICRDSDGLPFIITHDNEELKKSDMWSASSVLCRVISILTAFELWLNDELTWEDYEDALIKKYKNYMKLNNRDKELLISNDSEADILQTEEDEHNSSSSVEGCDDLKRKRAELKRMLINGEKFNIPVSTDWKKILDEIFQSESNYKFPTDISFEEFEKNLCLVLFDPWTAYMELTHNIYIQRTGWDDKTLLDKKFRLLDSCQFSFSYINKTYCHLLKIVDNQDNEQQLHKSANDFQSFLINFFYDYVSVEFVDSHTEFYDQDWERKVDFETNLSVIKYHKYDYLVSQEFIKRIHDIVFDSPKSLLGKLVFVRKVNRLEKAYQVWREENKEILKTGIEKIYNYHK